MSISNKRKYFQNGVSWALSPQPKIIENEDTHKLINGWYYSKDGEYCEWGNSYTLKTYFYNCYLLMATTGACSIYLIIAYDSLDGTSKNGHEEMYTGNIKIYPYTTGTSVEHNGHTMYYSIRYSYNGYYGYTNIPYSGLRNPNAKAVVEDLIEQRFR